MQTIKNIMLVTALMANLLLSIGCTTVKSSVVDRGATQYPSQIKPLIFANFSSESELDYWGYGKVPLKINGFILENANTHALIGFTFEANPFLSGSKTAPFKVDAQSNAVCTPLLITLPPGDYLLKNVGFTSTRLDANVYSIGIDLEKPFVRLSIPDKDFSSLGTVFITLKEKPGMDVGNVLQGYKLDNSKIQAELRTITSPERDFAVQAYPFLKNLNLTP
jgi:hypothetical protein